MSHTAYSDNCPAQTLRILPRILGVWSIQALKTEKFAEDWKFEPGCRHYCGGAQGFSFRSEAGHSAVVWIDTPDEHETVAEENDPGTVTVVDVTILTAKN